MEYSTEEPAIGKGLSEFQNDDEDMEEEDDEDEEKFITKYFKKRFLVKRKKLNDDQNAMAFSGEESNSSLIEQLMANLSIDEIFSKAKSSDLQEKLNGITQIRKLVSSSAADNSAAILNDFLSNSETLPLLIECLSLPNFELQFEAAWILTNIAAGNSQQTKALFDAFVHFALLKLIGTDCDLNVANQALWALGNIMADNDGFCFHCISADIMKSITNQMKRFPESVEFFRTVSWVMGRMSHLRESPSFKETAWDLFPALWELLKQQQKDLEVCINAIWGLGYLTDKDINLVMNFDKRVIGYVSPHLASTNLELQIATLHFFGNCVSGTDEITQEIIDRGVLKHLNKFLNHSNLDLKNEAAWMLSNILAGTNEQVNSVFTAGLMPTIIGLLESDETSLQEKALWAITNVPLCGSPQHINRLLDLDVLPPLCKILLTCSKTSILQSVVEAINGIQQQCGDRRKEIRRKILDSGAVDQLRQLRDHQNDAIQKNATQILNNLFNE
uniref:Importin subunit alpha n=1 Tax=Panagrolaimus sp. ES5 TaxID=591445 RepID=A0AC34F0G5_9BILA